jgi:hypothetical protein
MNYEKAVAVGGLKARGEVVLLRFNCGSLSVLLGFYWGFIGVQLGFNWGFRDSDSVRVAGAR